MYVKSGRRWKAEYAVKQSIIRNLICEEEAAARINGSVNDEALIEPVRKASRNLPLS